MRWWTVFAGLACLVGGPAAAQLTVRPDLRPGPDWRRDDDRWDYRWRDDWRRYDWRRDRRVESPEVRSVYPRDPRWDEPRFDRRMNRRTDDRRLWAYNNGIFAGTFADQGNGRWVETNNTGQFFFRESARTPDYVELFDDSRGMAARLFDNQLQSLGPGQTEWQFAYAGGWR
jgi:hypothetical protein